MTRNQEIAHTILAQLGGRRFTSMTGAKDLLAIESGLQFKLPARFAKDGINCVRIVLDPSDTYTVEFGKITRRQGLPHYAVLASYDETYCDQLEGLFEDVTGLKTRLF